MLNQDNEKLLKMRQSNQSASSQPKESSPEEAPSAPHSQEAAPPSDNARTERIFVVTNEPSQFFTNEPINDTYLQMEFSRFEDILAKLIRGDGEIKEEEAVKDEKKSRKRVLDHSTDTVPDVKRRMNGIDENVPSASSNSIKVEDNPLRKMELMTNSPVFEPTRMNTLIPNRKEKKTPSITPSLVLTPPSSSSIPPSFPQFPSSSHTPQSQSIPPFYGYPPMNMSFPSMCQPYQTISSSSSSSRSVPMMSPAFLPHRASPLASPAHPFPYHSNGPPMFPPINMNAYSQCNPPTSQ